VAPARPGLADDASAALSPAAEAPPPSAACLPGAATAANAPPQVNLRSGDYYRLDRQVAEDGIGSQLLCIQSDANPSLGSVYPGWWAVLAASPCASHLGA
jgi:hypothetical protein